LKKIRDGYEDKMVKIVTKSGSIIIGVLSFLNKIIPSDAVIIPIPFFTTATIIVRGVSTECKSVAVDIEDIEIIALLH